ncbi:hypothetical protein Q8A64_10650 [Oxalobacteraceae bacterium R-40]|uniref:Uncharacterized protein n=1 Tax=Keguizhuia sedimenti TaxID=3064264 RepID=A0ABU1BS16_9BURK|nr:hypothetical protein [Oxalobacteraceae bacterium R-40]
MKAFQLLFILISAAAVAPCAAQSRYSDRIEQAVRLAAPPERKIRTLGHEWVWELEQAGVYSRSRPKQIRVGLPLMTLGDSGADLIATYASPSGASGDRRWMLFIHVPLD